MNPELTYTLPKYQTASGCTDILMHTMERYFTSNIIFIFGNDISSIGSLIKILCAGLL